MSKHEFVEEKCSQVEVRLKFKLWTIKKELNKTKWIKRNDDKRAKNCFGMNDRVNISFDFLANR